MQKLILSLLLLIISISYLYAQSTIRGSISDTIEKKVLKNGSVMLLHKSDSILVSFARTDAEGRFLIKNVPAGRFLVLVTYPAYADYVDEIEIKDSSSEIDLPQIMMTLKSQLLKEVVVTNNNRMHIKGDTTEYKADSFKLQANATVEDLLKKLPGIQVDKNGKITTQGETVQKVLVDGEEFFGDDPTLVTKSLRADMVDKIQVYDKKSDQAAFTGIDDGQKTKTLNIALKEDKKNGYFGKLSAGAATDGYYDGQLLFDKFKKKEKFALYGILSNTGTAGLGWNDQSNYGGGSAILTQDANGNIVGQDDISGWDGNYSGSGYPLVQTGGIHFNNKWDNDKESINGNYKILQLNVNGNTLTNSEYLQSDSSYYQNQQQHFNNQVLRNKLSGSYELQIDSSSSLKLTADGTLTHKITNSASSTQSFLVQDSTMLNNGNSKTTSTGDNTSFNGDLLWRKKFQKKGRTISLDFSEKYADLHSTGYLYSQNNFFLHDTLSLAQLTDEYKIIRTQSQAINTNATYTEPLSLSSSLIANYGIQVNNSIAYRNSYNKSQDGKYDSLDNIYSNDYSFNTFTQKGGLYYSYIKKKYRFYAGSNVGYSNFVQEDLMADTIAKRNFVNWYPNATLSYIFSGQASLFLRYNGSTTQPSMQQIQPLRNNDDPLNISIGNAALKPSFQNTFTINYYSFKPMTNNNIYGRINYSFNENAISTASLTDSIGRRITQFINVNGNYSLSGNIDYGFKWKKPAINFNLNGAISQNRNLNLVNSQKNTTNSDSYTAGFYIGKYIEKKYDISVNGSITYTTSFSSIQTSISTRYWSYSITPNIDYYLPYKMQFHADLGYTFRQKTSAFENNTNVALLNGWIGKKFMKNDALLVKISGNDILNQNKGINRNVSSNFISQTTNTTIQQYFMLSFVWNFSKAGITAPQGGGMIISN
jgi:hypothetical protein